MTDAKGPVTAEEIERLRHWRDCTLDDPADRLYHAADHSWWRRDGWRLVGAESPVKQDSAREAKVRALVEAAKQYKRAAKRLDGESVRYVNHGNTDGTPYQRGGPSNYETDGARQALAIAGLTLRAALDALEGK